MNSEEKNINTEDLQPLEDEVEVNDSLNNELLLDSHIIRDFESCPTGKHRNPPNCRHRVASQPNQILK